MATEGIVRRKDIQWVTKEGDKIYPRDMTESHLHNTIKYLERRAPYMKRDYEFSFLTLPKPRGDMASDSYEGELFYLMDMDPIDWLKRHWDIYDELLKEVKIRELRRGLIE